LHTGGKKPVSRGKVSFILENGRENLSGKGVGKKVRRDGAEPLETNGTCAGKMGDSSVRK